MGCGAAVVVVVVVGRAVVGGRVVTGDVVATGGTVVVVTSVKVTPGLVTVVAGAGGAVVATGGDVPGVDVVTVVGTVVGVDVVVEPWVEVVEDPGALSPSITTVDGGTRVGSEGRNTFAAGRAGDVSRERAARMMPRETVPTTSATRAFDRNAGSRELHQMRIRSGAGGRPNAAFLPMDDHAR